MNDVFVGLTLARAGRQPTNRINRLINMVGKKQIGSVCIFNGVTFCL